MKRIYLDQWAWIGLAKAARGKADGVLYSDALDVIRYAAARGLASFPLSPSHYMELAVPGRRRHDVGSLMHEISKRHSMIGPTSDVVHAEIDRALQRRFGVPTDPRTVGIFGAGIEHAFGIALLRGRMLGGDGRIDPVTRQALEDAMNELAERSLLTLLTCGNAGGASWT